jgi:hypothetical protein
MRNPRGWFRGLLIVVGVGCSGDGAPSPDPASEVDDQLTIQLFDRYPYVNGTSSNAGLVLASAGDVEWTQLAGNSGVYKMPLADRYSVVVMCGSSSPGASDSDVRVFYGTAADGAVLKASSCNTDADTPTVLVTVDVQNVPAGLIAEVGGPGRVGAQTSDASGSLELALAPGPSELFAALVTPGDPSSTKLVRIPPFMLQDPRTFTIDFATAELKLERRPLTVRPVAADAVVSWLTTPLGTYDFEVLMQQPTTFGVLPTVLRRAGDRDSVTVLAGTQTVAIVGVPPGPLIIDLPPELPSVSFSATSATALQPTWTFATVPGGTGPLELSARTASSDKLQMWSVHPSRSWLSSASSLSITLPDLGSALDVVPIDISLSERTKIYWSVTDSESPETSDGSTVTTQTALYGTAGVYCGNGVVDPPEQCDPPDFRTCSADCMME